VQVRKEREDLATDLQHLAQKVNALSGLGPFPRWNEVRALLAVDDEESLRQLSPPKEEEGYSYQGKAVRPDYLWERWWRGQDAGVFKSQLGRESLWRLTVTERGAQAAEWKMELMRDAKAELQECARYIYVYIYVCVWVRKYTYRCK